MILQKTDKTPDAVELYDLKLIWLDVHDRDVVLAFKRLMKQLAIKFKP